MNKKVHTDSDFRPAWWLRNRHLQTIWPARFRNNGFLPVSRERLTTNDGDFIDLDWCGQSRHPIVILLHGLAGSSQSSYIRGLQKAISQMGWRSVALNFRGCSGQPNLKARSYHSGETGDIHFLYEVLRRRYPGVPMAAIGFSLGGNVLLKWLGERGNSLSLIAAVGVSVPFQLDLLADRMDQGFSRIYRNLLIKELKQDLRHKLRFLESNGYFREAEKLRDLGDLTTVRSFWEFDDRVVAPLYFFKDAHDYYRQSSCRQFLRSITIPTLLIHSIDDPFMIPEIIPSSEELASVVSLDVTDGGGHVGFVSGTIPGRSDYWLDQRVARFLHKRFYD